MVIMHTVYRGLNIALQFHGCSKFLELDQDLGLCHQTLSSCEKVEPEHEITRIYLQAAAVISLH